MNSRGQYRYCAVIHELPAFSSTPAKPATQLLLLLQTLQAGGLTDVLAICQQQQTVGLLSITSTHGFSLHFNQFNNISSITLRSQSEHLLQRGEAGRMVKPLGSPRTELASPNLQALRQVLSCIPSVTANVVVLLAMSMQMLKLLAG